MTGQPRDNSVNNASAGEVDVLGEVRRSTDAAGLCPVDRVSRRKRNKRCIALIAIGAINFLLYTVTYAAIGGDAHNGRREVVETGADATARYYVAGHFIRSLSGREREVSRATWIYSYLHSISVLATSGAMILAMLVLARPHIIATMRDAWPSGYTFVTAFGTIVLVLTSAGVILFTWDFLAQLTR